MEVRLDTTIGENPAFSPAETFVCMRIGDVQKQARLTQSRTFVFPESCIRDYAKVEIFQRIGVTAVRLDDTAETGADFEVPCNVPGMINHGSDDVESYLQKICMKLFVQNTGKAADRKSRAKKRLDEAQQYLAEHHVEDLLASAMKEVIRDKPEDPQAYLSKKMGRSLSEGKLKSAGFNEKSKRRKDEKIVPVPLSPHKLMPIDEESLSARAQKAMATSEPPPVAAVPVESAQAPVEERLAPPPDESVKPAQEEARAWLEKIRHQPEQVEEPAPAAPVEAELLASPEPVQEEPPAPPHPMKKELSEDGPPAPPKMMKEEPPAPTEEPKPMREVPPALTEEPPLAPEVMKEEPPAPTEEPPMAPEPIKEEPPAPVEEAPRAPEPMKERPPTPGYEPTLLQELPVEPMEKEATEEVEPAKAVAPEAAEPVQEEPPASAETATEEVVEARKEEALVFAEPLKEDISADPEKEETSTPAATQTTPSAQPVDDEASVESVSEPSESDVVLPPPPKASPPPPPAPPADEFGVYYSEALEAQAAAEAMPAETCESDPAAALLLPASERSAEIVKVLPSVGTWHAAPSLSKADKTCDVAPDTSLPADALLLSASERSLDHLRALPSVGTWCADCPLRTSPTSQVADEIASNDYMQCPYLLKPSVGSWYRQLRKGELAACAEREPKDAWFLSHPWFEQPSVASWRHALPIELERPWFLAEPTNIEGNATEYIKNLQSLLAAKDKELGDLRREQVAKQKELEELRRAQATT